MPRKLIAFDLDGTLITEESSWGKINEHFGNLVESSKSMQQYLRREIDYVEWMRRDISAWPKPLHVSNLKSILSGWTLRDGAQEVIKGAMRLGARISIITGGLSILAEEVANHLGVQLVLANELVTDLDGFITGEGIMRVDPLRKDRVLEQVCKSEGLSVRDAIAVGDSQFDEKFLKTAGIGLLIGNKELARRLNVGYIRNLREVLDYVEA